MKNIIFLTKDAQASSYFPRYGNRYWKTPNLDELASKGTVFNRHYTAAVSTAMAFTSIALGKNCFETNRKRYEQVEDCRDDTIFDKLYSIGYDVNIAWDISYKNFAKVYFGCEGKNSNIINIDSIIPKHSPHLVGTFDDLTFYPEKETSVYIKIEQMFKSLSEKQKPVFLWLHLPHVLDGRNSYGSDIDMFDYIIGIARKFFRDNEISVSADHGNMDGANNKFGYGFDTHENVIRVPLITPLLKSNLREVDYPTSHLDLFDILVNGISERREFLYADTAYYIQPNRKLSVIHNDFKLTFDKLTKKFTLYDVIWDREEKYNLFYPEFFDSDRRRWYSLNQRFFYPKWSEAHTVKEKLLIEFERIYREGTYLEEKIESIKYKMKILYINIFIKRKSKKKIVNIGK